MFVLTVVLAVVVGGGFLMAGMGKVSGQKMMLEVRDHLGVAAGLWKAIGALEVAGAVGVLIGLHEDLPVIGVLAGIGLVLLTIGAGSYHQKAGDTFKDWLPAVVMGSMSIFYIIVRIGTA